MSVSQPFTLNHQLPKGYKQTEVGVIPEEWEVRPLGELASVSAGGTPSRSNPQYWNGDIPWVTTSEVDFYIITRAEQFITKEGLSNSAAKLLPPGTLLMALYGQGKTRGKTGILGIEAATNQACAAILLYRTVSPAFIFHFLSSQYENIRKLSNTGNQENLNGSLVRAISILCPPLAEQRAIAEALSDVDGLLGALDRLIAKKRDLKQAAMQQLLTGQTRLPGFAPAKPRLKQTAVGTIPDDWDFERVQPLAAITTGSRNTQDRVEDGAYPFFVRSSTVERINSYSYEGEAVLTAGDGVGTGKVFHYINGRFDCHQRVYRISDFSPRLVGRFFFLVFSTRFYDRIMSMTAKSSVDSVRMEMIANMLIPLPSAAEQTAIAEVLSEMDGELAGLEQRREKTRALKQGMMQELLTGRTRLVPPSGTTE